MLRERERGGREGGREGERVITLQKHNEEGIHTVCNLFKLISRLWVRVLVRMIFHGQFAKGFLYLSLRGRPRDAQKLIVVLLLVGLTRAHSRGKRDESEEAAGRERCQKQPRDVESLRHT